ncbi:MAG: DUF4139 domain-containing protein [Halothiobacillaceae bacterium]
MLLLAVLPAHAMQAAPVAVESTVSEVFLAPDAAVVSREFSLSGEAGAQQFLLTGLPAGLVPDSLRVTTDAELQAALDSVDFRLSDRVRVVDSPRVVELKARLAEAERALAALDAERSAVGLRLEALEGLARGLGPKVQENEALQGLEWLEEIEIRALALNTRLAESAMQRSKQEEEITTLREEIERIQARESGGRSLVLSLRAVADFSGQFTLSYRHPAAGWTPVYEADLDTSDNTVRWRTRARIRQQTGEDWTDVALRIGMNDRRSWRPVPALESWEISLQEPVPAMREADRAMASEALMLAQSPLPGGGAQLEGTPYALEYAIEHPVSLGSGTDEQLLTLDEWQAPATVAAWTAPRQSATAVVVGSLGFGGAASLPPGELLLQRDGQQVGRTRVAALIPDQELELSFGVDPGIEVEYRDAPEKRDERGLIGRHKQVVRDTRMTVTNRHDRPTDVRVFDRLPVPLDADIAVEPANDNTPPTVRNVDGRAGVLAWDLSLEPGATGTVRFGYTVRWPADKQVPGLLP